MVLRMKTHFAFQNGAEFDILPIGKFYDYEIKNVKGNFTIEDVNGWFKLKNILKNTIILRRHF